MSLPEHSPLSRGRLLWSAGVVCGASLPHALVLPPWITALLVGCVLWRLEGARRGWKMPGRRLRVLLTLMAFVAVLSTFRTVNGVEAGSALLVMMVALKFLEARSHRDQIVLTIIAFFLVFAALIDQQSLFIGGYLLVFVLVTTAGLLQLGRRGPLQPMRATTLLAGRMLLQALPVMLVLFVLFPRLSGPLWALPNDPQRATTGLSDRMSPGDITELARSDEVAFRVDFADAPPPVEALYWRGPVLSAFDGRAWSRRWSTPQLQPGEIEYLGEPLEYRVMLEASGRGWTFGLDMPREWSGVERMAMTGEYQLLVRFGREITSRLDYRVVSHTSYRALDPLEELERLQLTRLPDDANPRTLQLVRSWLGRGLDHEALISEALRYFREQPFRYTLTPPALGDDSVDAFLFDTLAGFCGHYASALTVIMRAAGAPARVVTGYQGGERNAFGEYYIIRQSDAHAWVEVWLEDRGWVRVDPTAAVAPERIELGAAASAIAGVARGGDIFRTARYAWDAVNTYWYTWVIGYGETRQRMFLRGVGLDWASPAALSAGAIALIAAIVALLAAYYGLVQRRRKRVDAAARCYAVFIRTLARHGVAPPRTGEGPASFAAEVARVRPELGPAANAIAAAYVGARYEPDPHGLTLARLERLVGALRRMRRGAAA